jgi:hypothetical protein
VGAEENRTRQLVIDELKRRSLRHIDGVASTPAMAGQVKKAIH